MASPPLCDAAVGEGEGAGAAEEAEAEAEEEGGAEEGRWCEK